MISGTPAKEFERVSTCEQNQFENGDLDFDGTGYRKDWPNGSRRFPQSFRYLGPFTNGHPYPQIQFETDVAASENLCNVGTGAGCKAPPTGSAGFYPFWSLTSKQKLKGVTGRGACLWNFGNIIRHVTVAQLRQGRAVRRRGHRAVRRDHHQQGPAQPGAGEGLQAGHLGTQPLSRPARRPGLPAAGQALLAGGRPASAGRRGFNCV